MTFCKNRGITDYPISENEDIKKSKESKNSMSKEQLGSDAPMDDLTDAINKESKIHLQICALVTCEVLGVEIRAW